MMLNQQYGNQPNFEFGIGVVYTLDNKTRRVDIKDVLDGETRRATMIGKLPPVLGVKRPDKKLPRPPRVLYVYPYGKGREAFAFFIDSTDVDEDDQDAGYLFHNRSGGFRVTVDANGATAQIEQTKSDGNAGPTVTLNGSQVIIGDSGSAKEVSRKGDEVLTDLVGLKITGPITPGPAGFIGPISKVELGGGPLFDKAVGEITEGSDILKTE
jgi:hypothetical protein